MSRSDNPLELMRRSADALQERAGGRPVVLGVDDAQLLDPPSAALVLHLTETGAAFIVCDPALGRAMPGCRESLWKDAGAIRLDLQTLSEEDTGALVEAVLGAPVEERARLWLFERSQGNVLYVRELLLGALASGALRETRGFWQLTRRPPPSRSLTELVEVRMAGLDPNERAALELLALGEPLRLSEMMQLVGPDVLAAVEQRGLVRLDGPSIDDSVRVAHSLYAEVVRESMPVTRAHEVRLRLAELLQGRADRTSDDALRIAHWLLDAGQPIPVELSIEAADAAIPAGAVELGAQARRSCPRERRRCRGRAAARTCSHDLQALRRGRGGARSCGVRPEQPGDRVRVPRPADDVAVLEPWPGPTPPWSCWPARTAGGQTIRDGGVVSTPIRLYFQWLVYGSGATLAATEEILRDSGLEPAIRRRLEIVHATNLFFAGRAREAVELAVRVRPSVPLRGVTDELALDMCCLISGEAGEDMPELVEWMVRTLEKGVRIDDHAAVGIAAINLAEQRTCEGRYVEAARLLAESITQFERRDPFGYLAMAHGFLVGVNYYTGDTTAAEAAMHALPRRARRP